MRTTYFEHDDILVLRMVDKPIVREVSQDCVLRDDVSRCGGAPLDDYLSSGTVCFSDRAQLALAGSERAVLL